MPRAFELIALLVLAGLLGLALRFTGEPTRLFWSDEAVTALRVSGHTARAFVAANAVGKPRSVSEILRFTGRGEHGSAVDTVRSLANEDAQHPPLFYVMTALWTRVAGMSIAQLRAPALLFGLLVPFAVAGLCWELIWEPACRGCRLCSLITVTSPLDTFAAGSRIHSVVADLRTLHGAPFTSQSIQLDGMVGGVLHDGDARPLYGYSICSYAVRSQHLRRCAATRKTPAQIFS